MTLNVNDASQSSAIAMVGGKGPACYTAQAIFRAFEEYGFGERFPIVDFYLNACADHPVYGIVPEKLRLIDVGKMDSLAEAERLYSSM